MELKLNLTKLVNEPIEFEKVTNDLKTKILSEFQTRHDKCTIVVDGEELEVTAGQALLNLFLLSMFKGRGYRITKNDLFLKESISSDDIENYFNKVLTRIKIDGNDFASYRKSVYEFLNSAINLSNATNIKAGNTIDFLEFIEIESDDPDAKTIFSADIPYGLQFNEIENLFSKKGKDIINYFNNHMDRNLSPFTRSKTGINVKQMTQTLGFIGLKPTFTGGIIPKVITSNFIHGLDKIEDYFIIAKGARLALSTNYKMVRVSGLVLVRYLFRKLAFCIYRTINYIRGDNDEKNY